MVLSVVKELLLNDLTWADAEATQMLDTAMWDVISETNQLNQVQVCYLCHESQNAIDESIHVSQGSAPTEKCSESSMKTKETDALKRKLARSHYFPNSILKRFSRGHPLPVGHVTYQSLFDDDKLKSAKQVTKFMLCTQCESLISKHGEVKFCSMFFDRIYDIDDPLQSQAKMDIKYEKWLYHFCIGMIFRNHHWHRGYYTNENELYELLVQCRKFLLNPESDSTKPEVYLLINPLHASMEEAQQGHMNMVLNNSCASCLRDISLKDGALNQMNAHFFIVHMGVINILVKFSPAADVHIAPEFRVNPDGGMYPVPPEEERKKFLPTGVWKLFQSIAQDIEIDLRVTPVQQNEWMKSRKQVYYPSENVKDSFGIMKGFDIDCEAAYTEGGIRPAFEGNECKKVNLLPSSFNLRPGFQRSGVILPENHRVLIHYTEWKPEKKFHSVLFLCVGDDANYSLDSPYIIWHYEQPGLECSVGFFISVCDFKATVFLPDQNTKAMLKDKSPESLSPFIKRLPQLIAEILKEKGFYSLQSLLLRLKMMKNLPVVDMKCAKKKACWYCRGLCHSCLMKPSAYGFTETGSGELEYNFCDVNCQRYFPKDIGSARSVLVTDSEGKQLYHGGPHVLKPESRCCPLQPSHKEILHIFVLDTDSDGVAVRTELVMCSGDGSEAYPESLHYVVVFRQTLSYQFFFELYVSQSDFSPLNAVPHFCEVSKDAYDILDKIPLQVYIHEALKHTGPVLCL